MIQDLPKQSCCQKPRQVMEKVIDNNYELLITTLDPQVLAPHLKAHLSVGGSSLYYQRVRDKEKTPQEQTMELLDKLRTKRETKFWEEFVDICHQCGYSEVARIFIDGIKEAKRRHKFPPQNRKPIKHKPKKEVEFRGSKAKFKDVMDHNWSQLLETIDPDILIPLLKPQLTVHGNDLYYQKVTQPKVKHERNEILLDIIHKRKDMWKPFYGACQKCEYGEILEMFKEVRFEKDDAKNNGKKRSSRIGSMSPKPERNSLSSEEDTTTVYTRTQSHVMAASDIGGAHESPNTEGTNQTFGNATGIVGDASMVADKAYGSMSKGTPKADLLRNGHYMLRSKEDIGNMEGAGSTHQTDRRERKANPSGNTDNIVKPEPGQKVMPTDNLPNLDQILPSDSSHISETNEGEASVRTEELFEPDQTKETPCQKNGKESDHTLYISTLPSSMSEGSLYSPKDRTEEGYRPEFLRSDCCDTSTDAELLRVEALRKQEALSEHAKQFGHRNQRFNHKDMDPYEEDNKSKGSGELLPNDGGEDNDVQTYDRGGNDDADISDGSESTQRDDQEQLEHESEGHEEAFDEDEKQTNLNREVIAGSDQFGPNQHGSHPEMRTDVQNEKDGESREHISNNREVMARSDEFGPNQHGGHPGNRISLVDNDETTSRKRNAGVKSESAQHDCFSETPSNLEENNSIASMKPTDRIGVKKYSAELGPEQHGSHLELAKRLQEKSSSQSKICTDQNGKVMVESVEPIQNESRASRLYRSLPFVIEAWKCTDVAQVFSLPIFTHTNK